jgi:hypothetical protein
MEDGEKAILTEVKYTFIQDGNTNGTTETDESLDITMESVIGSLDEEKGFYVLRTTTGWSVNEVNDFIKLFDQMKNIRF